MRTTATSGHPRRSADQWRAIIQRYESSDLSQREFCSQEGLTLTSFTRWLRRFRSDNHQPGFVELQSEPPLPAAESHADWTVVIDLPGGGRLRLSSGR